MSLLLQQYIKKYLTILTLIIFTITSTEINAKTYIKPGSSMNSWSGFFNPSATICVKDIFNTRCTRSMYNGECKYLFPTNVAIQLEDTEIIGADGNKYPGPPKLCGYKMFACDEIILKVVLGVAVAIVVLGLAALTAGAASVTIGVFAAPLIKGGVLAAVGAGAATGTTLPVSEWNKLPGGKIGCLDLPLAPGPPPFCERLQSYPEVRVVPVQYRKFDGDPNDIPINLIDSPKIRIIIGNGNKTCDNGVIIPASNTCSDNSIGIITDYAATYTIENNGAETTHEIDHNHYKHKFKIRYVNESKEICAKHKTLNYDSEEHTYCIPAPELTKPILTKVPGSTIDSPSIDINFPLVGHQITLNYGEKYDVGDTNIQLGLIRPTVNQLREFIMRLTCSDGGNIQNNICSNGDNIDSSYKENTKSNAICLTGLTDNNYYMRQDGDILPIKQIQNTYYLEKIVSLASSQANLPTDISTPLPGVPSSLQLTDLKQKELDTIRFLPEGNKISININGNTLRYISFDGRIIPIADIPPSGISYERAELTNGDTVYLMHTPFEDIYNRPFLMTKEQVKNNNLSFYRPLDQYNNNLCVIYNQQNNDDKFDYVDYDSIKPTEYFNVDYNNHTCDFIKVEAWGGGASGFIHNPSDNRVSRNGLSFSGSSGGYATAIVPIIKPDPKNPAAKSRGSFKIKVGKGGRINNAYDGRGEDTEVEICDDGSLNNGIRDNPTNCKKIVVAMGGGAFRINGLGIAGNTNETKGYIPDIDLKVLPANVKTLPGFNMHSHPESVSYADWHKLALVHRYNEQHILQKIQSDVLSRTVQLSSNDPNFNHIKDDLIQKLQYTYERGLFNRNIIFGEQGMSETTTQNIPNIPRSYIVTDDLVRYSKKEVSHYLPQSYNICYGGNIPSPYFTSNIDGITINSISNNLHNQGLHGAGGCVKRTNNIVQDGADGFVKLTCEQWGGYVNTKSFKNSLIFNGFFRVINESNIKINVRFDIVDTKKDLKFKHKDRHKKVSENNYRDFGGNRHSWDNGSGSRLKEVDFLKKDKKGHQICKFKVEGKSDIDIPTHIIIDKNLNCTFVYDRRNH